MTTINLLPTQRAFARRCRRDALALMMIEGAAFLTLLVLACILVVFLGAVTGAIQ